MRRKKWECSAERRSQDGVCGEHGGSVDCVRVDEVVHDAQEDEDHAEAEGHGAEDADNPVDAGAVRPCEPKEADG